MCPVTSVGYGIAVPLRMLPHKLQTLQAHAGNRALDQRTERDLCPVTGFLKHHLTPTCGLHPHHSSWEDTTFMVRNHLLAQIYFLELISIPL